MNLIQHPIFKEVPYCDLANTNDNIDLWIRRKRPDDLLSRFIIECDDQRSYKGYRFIDKDDLTETVMKKRFVCGIELEVVFIRYYKSKDGMNPLWFIEDRTEMIIKHERKAFLYQSDDHLRTYCSTMKSLSYKMKKAS